MFVNAKFFIHNSSYQNGFAQKKQANKFTKPDNDAQFSFSGGINAEVLKNQLRIFLTQDIWAEKLNVKVPESPVEKEVLLEILKNRLKLDRFAKLSNEKATLKGNLSYMNDLLKNNPLDPDLPMLKQEITRKGNINSVLKTLDKQIELERKKNESSWKYFKDIEKIEDEYIQKRLMKTQQMEKFWYKIMRNNINKNGEYSTQELIDIISNDKLPSAASKTVSKTLSKKDLFAKVEKEYEKYLRENVNIYQNDVDQGQVAYNGQQLIQDLNTMVISKYPGIEKQLHKIYKLVEKKYLSKLDRINDVDIYLLNKDFLNVNITERAIRKILKDINYIEEQQKIDPANKVINEELKVLKETFEKLKQNWLNEVKYIVKYENINRQIFSDAGLLQEYEYLVGENKTIKRFKDFYKLYNDNNANVSQEVWINMIS